MSASIRTHFECDTALIHDVWRQVQCGPSILTADALCRSLQLVYDVWAGIAQLGDLRDVVEHLRSHGINPDQALMFHLLCGISLER
jgi:hypothetical protein